MVQLAGSQNECSIFRAQGFCYPRWPKILMRIFSRRRLGPQGFDQGSPAGSAGILTARPGLVAHFKLWPMLAVIVCLKNPAFAEAYRLARRELVALAIGQLQEASSTAVQTLKQIAEDAESPAAARVSAAKGIIDAAFRAVEIQDLEERIVKLEVGGLQQ